MKLKLWDEPTFKMMANDPDGYGVFIDTVEATYLAPWARAGEVLVIAPNHPLGVDDIGDDVLLTLRNGYESVVTLVKRGDDHLWYRPVNHVGNSWNAGSDEPGIKVAIASVSSAHKIVARLPGNPTVVTEHGRRKLRRELFSAAA